MKKFYVNERLFRIIDKYDVFDESGKTVYTATRRLFKLFEEFDLRDTSGKTVCTIKKRFSFLPKYELIINGRVVASVQKKLTFFVSKYEIESIYGDFVIDGSIMDWEFRITQGSKFVCSVSKQVFSFKDKYEISVGDIDEVLAIGIVVILDAIHHERW